MIKIDKGEVKIEGSKLVIRAEFTFLVNTLLNEMKLTKDAILKDVYDGFLTDKELEEKVSKKFKNNDDIVDKFINNFKELLKKRGN